VTLQSISRLALCRSAAAGLLLALVVLPAAQADNLAFPVKRHPWGHFPVGSSKYVRTTAEAVNDKGQVVSVTITDSRTTLVAADETTYTLTTDATVDVASRRITAPQQTVRYGYYGELPGQLESAKHLGDANLTIDGRTIPCEIRQVVYTGASGRLTSTLHLSREFPPFVLRRETVMENGSEEKRNSSLVEIVTLEMPHRIRGQLKDACYVKTTQKMAQGMKVTLEVHCDDVPGGVAAHWASEMDASGRVVRRSTLELIDYTVAGPQPPPQPGILRRPMRAGKAARRLEAR
jgi:hypothetical protein